MTAAGLGSVTSEVRAAPLRRCRCGTLLARDRPGDVCGVCETTHLDRSATPPQVPADFWTHPPMAEVLAERHMGRVLRAYRCHPWHEPAAVPQEVMGGWLHLSQAQISRVETGRARKHLGWLTFVARTLRIPADLLWFRLLDERDGAVPTLPPLVPNELIRRARLALVSPSGSGRVLSRQELAEAVNAWIFTTHGRRLSLTERSIGKFERGETRWPLVVVRAGLRAVLGVATDAEIGLFRVHYYARPIDVDQVTPVEPPHLQDIAAPATGLVSWEDVTEARRELGGLLSVWRTKAGLTQRALADRVRWARSTVANVERGQEVSRTFWQSCDESTGATGALRAAADQVRGMADRYQEQEADRVMRQRSAALVSRTGEPDNAAPVTEGFGTGDGQARDAWPAVQIVVAAGATVTIALGDGGAAGGQPVRVLVSAVDAAPQDWASLDMASGDGARVYSMAAWRGRH